MGLTTDVYMVVAVHHVIELVPTSLYLVPLTSKSMEPWVLPVRSDELKCSGDINDFEKEKPAKRLIKWTLPPPSAPLVPLPSWNRMAL